MYKMKTTSHYITSKMKSNFSKHRMAVTFESVHARTLPNEDDDNCRLMTLLFCRSLSYNFSSRFLSICEAAECGGRCSKYCW